MDKANLETLISFLDTGEKKWLSGLMDKTSDYYAWFQLHIKKPQLTEAEMSEQLGWGTDYTKRANVKKYLTQWILQKLLERYMENNAQGHLTQVLLTAEILYARGLLKMSRKLVQKGLREARAYEQYNLEQQLLALERRIIYTFPLKNKVKLLLHNFQEQAIVSHKLNVLSMLQNESNQLSLNHLLHTVQHSKSIKVLLLPPLLNQDPPEGKRAQLYYYQGRTIYYQLKQQESLALAAAHSILALCVSESWLAHLYPEETLEALKTAGRFYYWSSRHIDLRKITTILDVICKQPGLPHRYWVATKTVMYNYELITIPLDEKREKLDINALEHQLLPIFDFLKKNEKSISSDLIPVFYINFAYLYFMVQDYSKGLRWTNKILELSKQELRDDIADFTHLLRCLLLYELEEWEVCTYSLQQLSRLLKGRQNFKFFNLTQKLLLKLVANPTKADICTNLRNYLSRLKQLEKDPEEKKALLYFDLRVWATNKLAQFES